MDLIRKPLSIADAIARACQATGYPLAEIVEAAYCSPNHLRWQRQCQARGAQNSTEKAPHWLITFMTHDACIADSTDAFAGYRMHNERSGHVLVFDDGEVEVVG